MFKIGIENYTVYGRHGAYEFEHEKPQPFIVTIWVEITNHRFDDNLSQTVNYADLQNVAFEIIANSPPIKLMETMMEKMFTEISKNQLVKRIDIRIEKPSAQLPHESGLAVVEAVWPFE